MQNYANLAALTAAAFLVVSSPALAHDEKPPGGDQEEDKVVRIIADFDRNGFITGRDMYGFANAYVLNECTADTNEDGRVDQADFIEFANAWIEGR